MNSTNTKLYVDDLRDPPDASWDVARNFHTAIYMLENKNYSEVSLDHDIASFYGMKELTGRDILNWLIARKMDWLTDRKMNEMNTPQFVKVHSANVVGCQTMEEDIKRYFP